MDVPCYTWEQCVENEDSFLNQLKDDELWQKIPSLNVNELDHLKNFSLVRFRGMIQDMHSPEYYLETFEIVNQRTGEKALRNGKYRDAILTNEAESVNFESSSNVTSERQTYVVISVPGLNEWVKVMERDLHKIEIAKPYRIKKSLGSKRTYDDTMESECCEAPSSSGDTSKSTTEILKQQDDEPMLLSKGHILNLPLPDSTGKACHLKIYKHQDILKLNEVCEFVGFLASDPLVDAAHCDNDEDNKIEMQTLYPPSSLVPRIHCVSFKKLKHNNPLLVKDTDKLDLNRFNFIRKELLILFTQLLLGDELAAEYLILHLISEVYLRRDLLALGKFSLNLSNIPKLDNIDYGKDLYTFIEILVPKSYYLAMTLENMNSFSFVPKKDYECNRLSSGILQLSSNTHVILDETKLSPGKLDSVGINSVKAIANAIKNQSVWYDFNFYPIEYECDIPFLILSEGKSMVSSDCHIILQPEPMCIETFAEIVDAAKHFLKAELLTDMRKYLTLARLVDYEISEKVEELVQKEFVEMRQRGTITAKDLHCLLVLARLISISQGKTSLDEECWKKACNMEQARKSRLVNK